MLKKGMPCPKKLGLAAVVLSLFYCLPAKATYPNLDSMLEAIRPNASVTAPELNDLIIALDAIPTSQQRAEALQTLVPLVDGSLTAASEGPMRQMLEAIHDRLIQVMNDGSGYAAGDEKVSDKSVEETSEKTSEVSDEKKAEKTSEAVPEITTSKVLPKPLTKGAWIQILGDDISQRERDQVPGYKAQIYGAIIGRDWLVDPQLALGVAGGYQHARVVSRNSAGSLLGIKRLHGTLYGRYVYEFCPIFLQGSLTVASNGYDSDRKILVPPFDGVPFVRIAHADFSAWETNANVETGLMWKRKNVKATPKFMLTYSHLNPQSYVENDALGLDLGVKYEDMDALTLGAGLKLEYQNNFDNAYVIPECHTHLLYDFINDKQWASAYMTGGGFAFLSQGATPSPTTIEVGAGVSVHSYKNAMISLRYDYVARNDYHRQQAFIKVRYEWA